MSYQSVFKPGLFAGKVIVVTGGGSGIGRCTAHELAALGAHAVLIGRKLEKLQDVATEIALDGVGHVGHVSFTPATSGRKTPCAARWPPSCWPMAASTRW